MFCPNCGKKISAQQQYCRFCGLALERIAQSLAEQRPVNLDANLQARKEKLEQWGFVALCVFALGILLPLIYKIVKLLTAGDVWSGLGLILIIVLIGSGLLAAGLFAEAKEIETAKHKNRLASEPANAATEEEVATAQLLPPGAVPSVTERTTELLYAERPSGRE